jgi:thiamine kinase-like enzyme
MNEAKFLIRETSKINSIDIQPEDYYDEWSPVNLVNEFSLKSKYLLDEDGERVNKLIEPFSKIDTNSLVQTFVHGDIIRPNVLKDSSSKIYIIDFSCASLKPRVQELAILLCGMFFNEEDPRSYREFYNLVLEEYQPKLNTAEMEALPLFVKAGFSMYVMQGIYTKVVKGINHKENDYWIRLGQIGLKYLT